MNGISIYKEMPQREGGWCEPLQDCIEPARELLRESAAYVPR